MKTETMTFILTIEVGGMDMPDKSVQAIEESVQAIADAALNAAYNVAEFNRLAEIGPEVLGGKIRYAGRT